MFQCSSVVPLCAAPRACCSCSQLFVSALCTFTISRIHVPHALSSNYLKYVHRVTHLKSKPQRSLG